MGGHNFRLNPSARASRTSTTPALAQQIIIMASMTSPTTSAPPHQPSCPEQITKQRALADIARVNEDLAEVRGRLRRLTTRLTASDSTVEELTNYSKKKHMDANIVRTDIGMQGEAVTSMMFQLDSIESGGDAEVRAARKASVKACEAALGEQEPMLARATEVVKKHTTLKEASASIDTASSASASDEEEKQGSTTSDRSNSFDFCDSDSMSESSDSDSDSMSGSSDSSSDDGEDAHGEDQVVEHDDEASTCTATLLPLAGGRAQLRVHMPGIDPNSVDASVQGDHLIVTGLHVQAGRVEHSFSLPASLDQTSAQLVSCAQPGELVISFLTRAFVKQQQQQQQRRLQQQEAQSLRQRQRWNDMFGSSGYGCDPWSNRTHQYIPHAWF